MIRSCFQFLLKVGGWRKETVMQDPTGIYGAYAALSICSSIDRPRKRRSQSKRVPTWQLVGHWTLCSECVKGESCITEVETPKVDLCGVRNGLVFRIGYCITGLNLPSMAIVGSDLVGRSPADQPEASD